MKKHVITAVLAVLLVAAVGVAVVQAAALQRAKWERQERFCAHLSAAASDLAAYRSTGDGQSYASGVMELGAAATVAELLSGEAYRGIHGTLTAICGIYPSAPEAVASVLDDLIAVCEDFASHRHAPNLDIKLVAVHNRLIALLDQSAEAGGTYAVEFRRTDVFALDYRPQSRYAAGELVTVKLETVTEHDYRVFVNGEEIPMADADLEATWFVFIMPAADVFVEIEDVWVDIPAGP